MTNLVGRKVLLCFMFIGVFALGSSGVLVPEVVPEILLTAAPDWWEQTGSPVLAAAPDWWEQTGFVRSA